MTPEKVTPEKVTMGSQDMKAILMTLADGRRLGPAASQAAFDLIMEGQASAAQIGCQMPFGHFSNS